jgi:hypothetical protein
VILDPEVVALLPVLSAASVQLAHTVLGCVRLMESKVLKHPGEYEVQLSTQLPCHQQWNSIPWAYRSVCGPQV